MIHDEEIIGLIHNKKDKALTLYLNNGKTLIYREVVFFHFDNFSDQNIVFDIYDFDSKKNFKRSYRRLPLPLAFYQRSGNL